MTERRKVAGCFFLIDILLIFFVYKIKICDIKDTGQLTQENKNSYATDLIYSSYKDTLPHS